MVLYVVGLGLGNEKVRLVQVFDYMVSMKFFHLQNTAGKMVFVSAAISAIPAIHSRSGVFLLLSFIAVLLNPHLVSSFRILQSADWKLSNRAIRSFWKRTHRY